jgi:hypothetical protein
MSAHEMHETHEKIHEAGHGHHAPPNKNIAILISILAALLAIVEMQGKGAQTNALAANIEANDLWAFFQAKTIRMTIMRNSADMMSLQFPTNRAPAMDKQIADWQALAAKYDSEPQTNEGRKELLTRAKDAEARRDRHLATFHLCEYGAGALQIGIVLASAAVVTGVLALVWGALGLGVVGLGFSLLAWLAPTLIHI